MRLNKVSVTSNNLEESRDFYQILGFNIPEVKPDDQHIESIPTGNEAALMIDTVELIKDISGEEPKPGNQSAFAIEYDSVKEVDEIIAVLMNVDFTIVTKPWATFWGQYYAIVQDPNGYKVDLYVNL